MLEGGDHRAITFFEVSTAQKTRVTDVYIAVRHKK